MRALIGVSDRAGLLDFARALVDFGVDIVATDGTRRALSDAGIPARAVAEVTGLPEMLDGRVKTLHPAILAGILARRDLPDHGRQLADHGFAPFDIVCVSLYPFADAVAGGASRSDCIEKIDIGGSTMIRAAAKNSDSVTVVVSPHQYSRVVDDLRQHGQVMISTRRQLAAAAFAHVAGYDTAVATYLAAGVADEGMPEVYTTGGERLHEFRYGENPHQRGALYAIPGHRHGLAHARQVQGSDLSFTNWLDLDAAWGLVGDFDEPAAAVIKHTNPCGFAVGDGPLDAYRRAFECDPRAAFGGIVGLNRPLDGATAAALGETFLEAVIAPGITEEAAERLVGRKRLRILIAEGRGDGRFEVRSIDGGLLVQTPDAVGIERATMQVATTRNPTADEWRDLLVAWRVCRHVKSNAIVAVRDGAAVGVGAGQMSRVEAAEIAVRRAGARVRDAAAASDAFFPMADGLETLGRAGARAVIQPGGSKKDGEVIAAANALGMAMVMAGARHFRH